MKKTDLTLCALLMLAFSAAAQYRDKPDTNTNYPGPEPILPPSAASVQKG